MKRYFFVLLIVSAFTHFVFFGHPNQTVFDEVHFGKFISGYSTHKYFFDIHPPLGKLIIAGFGKLSDFKPEFSFAKIGDSFPDTKYKALRFLPSLAGMLIPLVLFLLALELRMQPLTAFAIGILTALDGALLVQSRFILLDSFLLLFGFAALLCYFRWRNGHGKQYFLAAGVLAGCAISVKWTGVSFLGLMLALEAWHVYQHRRLIFDMSHIVTRILVLVILPAMIYFAVFAVHFSLLTQSGEGDAFMTPGFQKTLKGNHNENDATLATPGLVMKFVELNVEMFESNQRLDAKHPYGSYWYTWPFMTRPIYYWVRDNARIYLLGNPVVWWLSTIAILTAAAYMVTGQLKRDRLAYIFMGGYVLNLLPFVGIKRVMFLYHYLAALIFAIFMLCYLIEKFSKKPSRSLTALIIAAFIGFAFFSPLIYGLELSPQNYEWRNWLQSWK